MEYSKSKLDFLFWPQTWHKRLDTTWTMLIPGCVFVGLFDVFIFSPSIVNDYLLNQNSGIFLKAVLLIVISTVIGFLDVLCFAWPIADLCRYLARRSESFIVPGFNIMLMKSYAYSHLLFLPVLLLYLPIGLDVDKFTPEMPFLQCLLIIVLRVLDYTQLYWQMGIMLRTVSVKSKLKIPAKLIAAVAMFVWFIFEGVAIGALLQLAYRLFGVMVKFLV